MAITPPAFEAALLVSWASSGLPPVVASARSRCPRRPTAPQGVHQVDDVGFRNLISRDGHRHALALTLDDPTQCMLVAVNEQRGIEVAALLVDNSLGKEHAWIGLRQIDHRLDRS
jgi:hypothetical protein